jgi:hypothetical protein
MGLAVCIILHIEQDLPQYGAAVRHYKWGIYLWITAHTKYMILTM